MSSVRIPLFPLEVVLFPRTPLPLHIFESRYKLMIRRCVEKQAEFGVVLARSAGIAPVGCTAAILKVIKQYDDGRMDILTVGQTPYRVSEVFNEEPYLEGVVEFLGEKSDAPLLETPKNLLALYEECHSVLYGRAPENLDTDAGTFLSFQIASELPLELEFKQQLLEMRTEAERRIKLAERLKTWLPQLAYGERARSKAGGNGHPRH